jgi:hypothetical protein
MLDRYYKMTGVQPTNAFEPRVLRIFEAGNLYEWLVRMVLIRSGLLVGSQKEITIKGDGLNLDVVGHLDFVGGGKPNLEEAAKIVPLLESLYFPTRMLKIADRIIDNLMAKFPDGLPHLLYEVKSVNSMVFWRKKEAMKTAYPHHVMQLYTYLKGMNMNEGRILYISKDDLTLAEVAIVPDAKMEADWQKDVSEISKYVVTKTRPEREAYVLWNSEKRGYEVNWMITRSNYFELITSSKDQKGWTDEMGKLASRANYRVKKSLEKKEDLTDEQIQLIVDPYVESELSGQRRIDTSLAEGKEVELNG